MNDDWRTNPKLAGMDRSKLDMLQNLASQGSSKGANEMLPFLMSAAAQGKKGGLKFNADEISAIYFYISFYHNDLDHRTTMIFFIENQS